MISRYLGAIKGIVRMALTATLLLSGAVWADGPGYTYIGASYEWTDVKYAVEPNNDPIYNFGSIEGVNLDASFGILGWLHFTGQYFDGDCTNCSDMPQGDDLDFSGFKLG